MTPKIDVQECCLGLLEIIKRNTNMTDHPYSKTCFSRYHEKYQLLCRDVAKYEYLYCLTFVHENGYFRSKDTSNNAALGGHSECLQYAHKCMSHEQTHI
jgi:hypothetical protein